MKQYRVGYKFSYRVSRIIEAESEEEAKKQVFRLLDLGKLNNQSQEIAEEFVEEISE